jgi:hypothetical protein
LGIEGTRKEEATAKADTVRVERENATLRYTEGRQYLEYFRHGEKEGTLQEEVTAKESKMSDLKRERRED